MFGRVPIMHRVVFAIAQERLDAATRFLEARGFRFQTHVLVEVQLATTFGMPLTLLTTNLS